MAFSNHDIVSDSPTNNFATLSPLWNGYNSSYPQSDGNLKAVTPTSGSFKHSSTMSIPKTGKWYFELHCTSGSQTDGNNVTFCPMFTGIAADTSAEYSINFYGVGYIIIRENGNSYNVGSAYDNKAVVGDIVGYYFDLENNEYRASINGTVVRTVNLSFYSLNFDSLDYFINISDGTSTVGTTQTLNFGQDPTFGGASNLPTGAGDYDTDAAGNSTGGRFAFQPPTGALALCTANLPEMTPTVDDDFPQDHFQAVAYDGASADKRIDLNFQPDLVWIKHRNSPSGHRWHDSVRGWNQFMQTNGTAGDIDLSSYNDTFKNVDSTGFTLPYGVNAVNYNSSGQTYVAWCFRAGGDPTADNSNTSGAMTANSVSLNGTLQSNYTPAGSPTIYPTRMSINTDAGFSIVKYTQGDWVPHGLNKTPEMIIVKGLADSSWVIYHKNAYTSNNSYLTLTNNSVATSSQAVRKGLPTSTVFSMYNSGNTFSGMGPGSSIIAYCWHSVEGYSKFGSYTGNGSTDGPFVYTGFRPAFLMWKNADDVEWWGMMDAQRSTYNPVNSSLAPHEPNSEFSYGGGGFDFLSNGFKVRGNSNGLNGSSDNIIFMALAEQPFIYSNAR